MKILSAEQLRAADAHTIRHQPIPSIELMEVAAARCFDWIMARHRWKDHTFHIYCGNGNNGGDGLALGRMLNVSGRQVKMYWVKFSESNSADFAINQSRLKEEGLELTVIQKLDELEDVQDGVVVDALFGSGLNRPLEGWLADVVRKINSWPVIRLAVDIPSGLFAEDNRQIDLDAVVHARHTLTFQHPKLSFLMPNVAHVVGAWDVLDIGLDQEFIHGLSTHYHLTTIDGIRTLLKDRGKFAHKGSFGHALLVAGSRGKMGAAVLSGEACLRSGAGLLTAHIPSCGLDIYQQSLPEAMVNPSVEVETIGGLPDLQPYAAVGIGPGIGTGKVAEKALKVLLQEASAPLVLDADAINILADNPTWNDFIPPLTILTPHPGEFRRLVGDWNSDEARLEKQIEYATRYGVIVLVKGAHTSIALPNGTVHFNSSGNPGMATAGSGDVLTGILTGLLAQGYAPSEATILGVFLHGMAGDFAAVQLGEDGMLAGDIVLHIPAAYKALRREDS